MLWRNVIPYAGIAAAVMFGVALAPYAWQIALLAALLAAVAFLLGSAWLLYQRIKAWLYGPEVIIEEPSRPR